MAQRDSLRERYEQHKPKNVISKDEDKTVAKAAERVIEYLKDRFKYIIYGESLDNIYYDLSYESRIKIGDILKFITRKGYRKWEEFDHSFDDKTLQPDGGVIYLEKVKLEETTNENGNPDINIIVLEKFPLVIAEVKHQGTNDKRAEEGKSTQASGNAIERLGKNLTGIKAMTHYETITPFICFGDGCDFMLDSETDKVKSLYEEASINFATYMTAQCYDEISKVSNKKIKYKDVLKTIKDIYKNYIKTDSNIKTTDIGKNSIIGDVIESLSRNYVDSHNIDIFTTSVLFDSLRNGYIETVINKLKSSSRTVRAKIFTLNEFYDLNKILIFKKDKSLDDGPFAPTSMMFRYEPWSEDEMFEYMKEIAETSFRYYTM